MTQESGPSLVQAARWIEEFRDSRVVVKIGGEIMARSTALHRIVHQIGVLRRCGLHVTLVHGAGVQVDRGCQARGIEIVKHGGRRVTSPEVLEVLVSVLAELNRTLCSLLRAEGLECRGMEEGIQAAIRCTKRPPGTVDGQPVDWGEVGDISSVDSDLLLAGPMAVLPSLGTAEDGLKNVNADGCAAQAAIALGAVKVLFLTTTPGLMRDLNDHGPISQADAQTVRGLIESGVATGGMKAKLEEALRALGGGVKQVHILSGRDPHGLVREIFTDEGVGTLIHG